MALVSIKVLFLFLNFTFFLTSVDPLMDTFDRENELNSTLTNFRSESNYTKHRRRSKDWLIIGGQPANVDDVPYFVSVRGASAINPTFGYLCGGSALSDSFVLTAAHCLMDIISTDNVQMLPYDHIEIRSRSNTLMDGGMIHGVTDICLPPDLGNVKDYTSGRDLAVVKVTPSIEFPGYANPVSLPDQSQSSYFMNMVENEVECVLSGYGNTETGKYSPQLLTAKMKLLHYDICKYIMADKEGVTVREEDHVCAVGASPTGQEGACSGDSGGALVCPGSDGVQTVWGVATYVYKCADLAPTLFTRVDTKLDFILGCIQQNKGSEKSVTDKLRPSRIVAPGFIFYLLVFNRNKHTVL